MSTHRLVIDVGGTNARFALADRAGALMNEHQYFVANYATFEACLADYLGTIQDNIQLAECVVAAAGPEDNSRITLTNGQWTIDRKKLKTELGEIPVALINDLQAVAAALPHVPAAHLLPIGAPSARRPETRSMVALNVGTGCGAATAVRAGHHWITVASEAGHMTLKARETELAQWFEPDATVESVLSGRGVVALYKRIVTSKSAYGTGPSVDAGTVAGSAIDVKDVFELSANGDLAAMETVRILSMVMGQFAGDLVLASAAWGGVYLCGSVATNWANAGCHEEFRNALEAKGAMSPRMKEVPAAVLAQPNIALFGLSQLDLNQSQEIP